MIIILQILIINIFKYYNMIKKHYNIYNSIMIYLKKIINDL